MISVVKGVMKVGGSRGVVLPKTWLDSVERKTGRPLEEVELDIDDEITIRPVPKRKG